MQVIHLPADLVSEGLADQISSTSEQDKAERDYRNHVMCRLDDMASSLKQLVYHLEAITDITGDEAKGED